MACSYKRRENRSIYIGIRTKELQRANWTVNESGIQAGHCVWPRGQLSVSAGILGFCRSNYRTPLVTSINL